MIQKEISDVDDNAALSELYKGLASLYKHSNQIELRALAFEKALEYSPIDPSLLFSTAYAFGEIDRRGLSLLHYRSLLQFNPEHTAAMNNLGVVYENLEMPIFSVNAYKEASKRNYTLPSANLAYRFMNAGFAEESKELLDKAKQQAEVHPNVGSAISALAEKEGDEENKRQKIMNSALQQQRFFRAYASALFVSKTPLHSFDGPWLFPDDIELEITFTAEEVIETNWIQSNTKYQLKGAVTKQAATITIYKMSYTFDRSLELGFQKDNDGYAYLSEDGQELRIMTLKNNEHAFIVLIRKTSREQVAEDKS